MTGGSSPPPQIISKMEELGFRVHHIYGITAMHGPGTYCLWKPEWDSLPPKEKYELKARQGVQNLCLEAADIIDPIKMGKVIWLSNIRTVEVERILYSHPAVVEAAVVARPDNHWGQTPCAFVKLKDGSNNVSDQEIINFSRDNSPHYMAPRTVIFQHLPRNSTGKILKLALREAVIPE
ncbi:hypothetical protein P3S68_017757 [Capsicum galapagoense]